VFPSLRKYVNKQARLVSAAEYHQMAGRAGRPQFDDKGLAITLAPEEVVSDLRRELKQKGVDPAKVRKNLYNRARSEAARKGEIVWGPEQHAELVGGEPAELRSKTKITAEQVLALGLPDLEKQALGAPPTPEDEVEASLQPSMRLDIVTVIDHLLLSDHDKRAHHKLLAQLVANMRALGVLDEHGAQISGQMIRELQGIDGVFVWWVLFNEQLDYVDVRQLLEYLVDHDVVQRILERKDEDKKREWCRAKLREMRFENPQVSWEDVEAEYDKEFPRVLTRMEEIHQKFSALVPHPELHGGKRQKTVWAQMEDGNLSFLEMVEREGLEHEEGSLFTYLVRVMNFAKKLGEASQLDQFVEIGDKIRNVLARVDARITVAGDRRSW